MPELPEVESARRSIEKALKGKRIQKVLVDPKDRIAFDRASPQAFVRALKGARVVGSGRKGKYFWLELDRRPWPVLHLGMSGNIEIRGDMGFGKAWGGVQLWSERNKARDEGEVPRYCRLLITTEDGTQVAMTDPRRFGRIRLAKDPLREPPLSRLGPDPLLDFPTATELRKTFAAKRIPTKALLLDQSYFAGVGNWIADEILFQAKISPHRPASSLSLAEIRRLRARTLSIVRKAVQVNADYARFPKSWLFHDRWEKGRGESYNSRGFLIQHDTVGGRTTAWIPALQK